MEFEVRGEFCVRKSNLTQECLEGENTKNIYQSTYFLSTAFQTPDIQKKATLRALCFT